MNTVRQLFLIAKGVWLEAIRRRDIYVIVALGCLLIVALARIRFFGLDSLSKFYRETALTLMSMATALTVIVLAARQLPREFSARTIYPLLARPVRRATFLVGKLLGVVGAGAFCLTLFLCIYALGCLGMDVPVFPALLVQHALLQVCMLSVLASLCFLLSIVSNLDAAVTFGLLFYAASTGFSNLLQLLYHESSAFAQTVIQGLTWVLPQLMVFDLSEKNVHGEVWPPLSAGVMGQLILYALLYTGAYLLFTGVLFRRKPL